MVECIPTHTLRGNFRPKRDGGGPVALPVPAKPKRGGSKPKPRVPCSTPGCGRLMTGGSPHGCRPCQSRAERQRARASGLCMVCREPCGAYRCEPCRVACVKANRRRRKVLAADRRACGECPRCGGKPAPHAVHCTRCLKKYSSYYQRKIAR